MPWEYRTAIVLTLARTDVPSGLFTADDLLAAFAVGLDDPAAAGLIDCFIAARRSEEAAARRLLIALAVAPAWFADQYGWRYLTPVETAAAVAWYGDLGRRAGIAELPTTFDEMEAVDADARAGIDLRHAFDAASAILHNALDNIPQPSPAARRAVTVVHRTVAPAAATIAAAECSALRPVLRAAYRQAGLLRRQVVLLRPNRLTPHH